MKNLNKNDISILVEKFSRKVERSKIGCFSTDKEYTDYITQEVLKHLLENNGEFTLEIPSDIYPSQVDFATKIYEAFKTFNIVIGKAPMQFGKTGTIFYLSNYLIGPHLKQDENIIFITAMSDTALFIQNQSNLQKDYLENGVSKTSKIIVIKMVPDFKKNAEQIIKDFNAKMIILDECDFGVGSKSVFNNKFYDKIKKNFLDVKLLLISATPYCALHAVSEGRLEAAIVDARVPENYFGVNKMIELNMVTDINNRFNSTDKDKYVKYNLLDERNEKISDELIADLKWASSGEGGSLSIIRAKNTNEAHLLKKLIEENIKSFKIYAETGDNTFETMAIGVHSTPIKDVFSGGSRILVQKVINSNENVILIVVNALSAGKDLGNLKEYVRLIIETRTKAIANGSQGLVGRLCGYHNNRNIRIIASMDVLKHYAELELDSNIIENSDFINRTVALGIDFTTQLSKGAKFKSKMVYEQRISREFTPKDIVKKNPLLLAYFEDNSYGRFDELYNIVINDKQTARNSSINSQRSSKYKDKKLFNKIYEEALDGTICFQQRFHRFRSEGTEAARFRIKRGILIKEHPNGKITFIMIDRLDDGTELESDATVNNKSCYYGY